MTDWNAYEQSNRSPSQEDLLRHWLQYHGDSAQKALDTLKKIESNVMSIQRFAPHISAKYHAANLFGYHDTPKAKAVYIIFVKNSNSSHIDWSGIHVKIPELNIFRTKDDKKFDSIDDATRDLIDIIIMHGGLPRVP